ncbi:MAG: P-II family nitrogen regulator [Thaumarchaeota archaeon]|nr:P-II family nitrogen regulator [Nitrososphaerota archaeon]
MKRVEAVVSPDKLGPVVEALKKVGVGGITIFDARGWGRASKISKESKKSLSAYEKLNAKIYVLTVVDDSIVDKVVSAILDTASTGSVGDGKIFIDNLDTAVDIGSGQKGVHAI